MEPITDSDCTNWDHKFFNSEIFPYLSANYCRNPGGFRNGPWCLTKVAWKYCNNIIPCQLNGERLLALKTQVISDVDLYDINQVPG